MSLRRPSPRLARQWSQLSDHCSAHRPQRPSSACSEPAPAPDPHPNPTAPAKPQPHPEPTRRPPDHPGPAAPPSPRHPNSGRPAPERSRHQVRRHSEPQHPRPPRLDHATSVRRSAPRSNSHRTTPPHRHPPPERPQPQNQPRRQSPPLSQFLRPPQPPSQSQVPSRFQDCFLCRSWCRCRPQSQLPELSSYRPALRHLSPRADRWLRCADRLQPSHPDHPPRHRRPQPPIDRQHQLQAGGRRRRRQPSHPEYSGNRSLPAHPSYPPQSDPPPPHQPRLRPPPPYQLQLRPPAQKPVAAPICSAPAQKRPLGWSLPFARLPESDRPRPAGAAESSALAVPGQAPTCSMSPGRVRTASAHQARAPHQQLRQSRLRPRTPPPTVAARSPTQADRTTNQHPAKAWAPVPKHPHSARPPRARPDPAAPTPSPERAPTAATRSAPRMPSYLQQAARRHPPQPHPARPRPPRPRSARARPPQTAPPVHWLELHPSQPNPLAEPSRTHRHPEPFPSRSGWSTASRSTSGWFPAAPSGPGTSQREGCSCVHRNFSVCQEKRSPRLRHRPPGPG